jgi:class 3 adenylate cyclase
MNSDRWCKINQLLDALLDLEPSRREEFLDESCGSNNALRTEVESLLRAHEQSEGFIESLPLEAVTTLFPQSESLLGSSLAHYQLLSSLGKGGMSEVYLARDMKLGRLVALKLLPAHYRDKKRIDRFRQEACAASALNHPNILTVYEIGEQAGCHFIVTEYVEGETLRQDLDARSDLFSLGVVLYEMLAGVRPFAGETPGDVIVELIEKDPPPLSTFAQFLPGEFERIVAKSLAKSPNERYQSASDLQSDLRALGRQLEVDATLQRVTCHQCGQENPGDFGYCGLCGATLNRSCPHCGREMLPSNQFCGQCGYRFEEFEALERTADDNSPYSTTGRRNQTLHSVVSPGAERRTATVVYAIVSGCAAILEQLDPHEADRIMTSIKSGVAEVITGHGGVVNRCSGEELVALFGVPSSDEDDFLRAVRASLLLQVRLNEFSRQIEARLGQQLQVSIGVSSGPVVTRLQGDEEYSVSGDALQIASRLAAQAKTDEILLSPETQRLVAPFFRLCEKGSLPLKPGDSPVMVYRVEGESGVRTRLEAAEVAGLTPYTGREKELEALLSSLERSLAGEGQIVTVVGDAGVGKSRLLLEFRRSIEQQSITLLQGRCQPHGTGALYGLFIDALRDLLGLQPETASESSRARAVSGVRAISADLEGYLQVYLHLLSINAGDAPEIDLHGDDLRLAIQEALSAIFTLHTKREPTVLLLEDWHWADKGSVEVLKRLAGFAPSYPLMLVVTCRPDRLCCEIWAFYTGKPAVMRMRLNATTPLSISTGRGTTPPVTQRISPTSPRSSAHKAGRRRRFHT